MDLTAARLDQVAGVDPAGLIVVDRDVGGVVEDIKRLDPHLGVRFSPKQKFFAVYWSSDDGRETYLVTTVQATQNASGTWEGLDHRVVRRLEEIDPHNRSGYEYAKALEARNRAAEKAERDARMAKFGEASELAAYAVRKDLGGTGRIVVPRAVSKGHDG